MATPPEVGQRHGLKQSKSVENPQQTIGWPQQQTQWTLLDWPRSKKLKGWKAETGERKAGVKEQGCEEQEDGEDKKEPLTAAGDQG